VRYIHQIAAVAVASGVAVASLAAPSAVAKTHPPTTTSRAAAAAGYLARQLHGKHHDHLVDVVGKKVYPDDGETADAVLSMDAAGVAQSAATRATAWLEHDTANYAGVAPDVYPGAAAKLLLVAEAQHVNPESFGSTDLVGALIGDEGAGGASPGEYQNPGDLTYGSSVLDQALAVLALANTVHTSGPSPSAISFLAGQQCDNGSFQVDIRANTTVDCAASADDVDTTAYAIQALAAAGDRLVAKEAVSWLLKVEHANGGWGETSGAPADANSTALAIEALVATHHGVSAAEKWLAKQQLGCASQAGRRGAVRFEGTFSAATAVRASSQVGAAYALTPLAWVDKDGARSAAPVLSCPAHHTK
jgi:Prenyltransferase and squalene oxidase repeat